ncbi:hypothetical protein MGH68_13530 [Erysipelothrix sp. D19-032]
MKKALSLYDVKTLALAGGVACELEVRKQMNGLKDTYPELNILQPPLWACMDQAAMIGLAAFTAFEKGARATCELTKTI